MHALSLASRFLITLVVSAVLPLLLYGWFSLRGMRDQIDEQVVRVFLPQLAEDYAQKIETRLERTDQACAIVRELSRRVLDTPPDRLDDELAFFEEQVELIPDLLSEFLDLLLLADADGRDPIFATAIEQRGVGCAHKGRRDARTPHKVEPAHTTSSSRHHHTWSGRHQLITTPLTNRRLSSSLHTAILPW